jgi:hypothetical protein
VTPADRRIALLLDEMFPPIIAEELRRRGHDVAAVAADPQLRAKTDPELFAWAAQQKRRLVTENAKDFRRLHGEIAPGGPGLLLTSSRSFPRSRQAPGALIAALEAWLSSPDVVSRPPEDWLVPRRDVS